MGPSPYLQAGTQERGCDERQGVDQEAVWLHLVEDGKRRQLGDNCPRLRRPDGAWNPRHGTWTFAISVKGTGGKRERVVRGGFKSQREAQAAMDELKGKAARGVVVAHRLTVSQYLAEWIDAKTDVKVNTLTCYTAPHRAVLRPAPRASPSRPSCACTTSQRSSGPSRSTTICAARAEPHGRRADVSSRIRATLRIALGDAMREGLITINPASLVKLPKAKRPKGLVWTDDRVSRWQSQVDELVKGGKRLKKARAMTPTPSPVMVWRPDQLGQFLDHAHDDRLYALWHLYAFRGLRRGEACGLEWPEIDLVAGSIAILRQRISVAGVIVEDTPKSDAGGRIIPLDQQTVPVLRSHRKQQMADRLAAGRRWVTSDKVFTAADGSLLDPNDVSDQFEDLTIAAGLPPIRLHDLRHGAASLMLAAGVDMKVVQETLGHCQHRLDGEHVHQHLPGPRHRRSRGHCGDRPSVTSSRGMTVTFSATV